MKCMRFLYDLIADKYRHFSLITYTYIYFAPEIYDDGNLMYTGNLHLDNLSIKCTLGYY